MRFTPLRVQTEHWSGGSCVDTVTVDPTSALTAVWKHPGGSAGKLGQKDSKEKLVFQPLEAEICEDVVGVEIPPFLFIYFKAKAT